MTTKILIAKQNSDGTETIIGRDFATDKEALAAVKEPGEYILYPVITVTKDDLKKED